MVKLLLVSTSAGSMGGNPTGLWLAELAEPWFVFKAAGFELVLASPAGGAIPVDCGSVKGDFFTEDAKKFMHDPEVRRLGPQTELRRPAEPC
jgi:putative intracellular protease/amidase|eukprot:COSAG06_NODE_29923_length_548_cov_0.877506_1_plen_92_part_00